MTLDFDQASAPGSTSKLLQTRINDIEVFDILRVRPEVKTTPGGQNHQQAKAVSQDHRRSVQSDQVKEAM